MTQHSLQELAVIDQRATDFESLWTLQSHNLISQQLKTVPEHLKGALFEELLLIELELKKLQGCSISFDYYHQQFPEYLETLDCISSVFPQTFFPEDYRVLAYIGHGAQANVWRGQDRKLPTLQVVLKSPSGGQKVTAAIKAEALNMVQLRHPNLVRVIGWRTVADCEYLILEYIHGGSLEDLLNESGPLSWQTAGRYVADVAEALQAVHKLGIVHRDVHPKNILRRAPLTEGGLEEALLTDFGVAARIDSNSLAGTPLYLPLDVFQQLTSVSPSQDVYALAATLFHLITGEPPFCFSSKHQAIEVLQVGLPNPDPRLEQMPCILADLIRKGLAQHEQFRPTLDQFTTELRNALNGSLCEATGLETEKLQVIVKTRKPSGDWKELATPQITKRHFSRRVRNLTPQQFVATGDDILISVAGDLTGYLCVFNVGPTGDLNALYSSTQPLKLTPTEPRVLGGGTLSEPVGLERIVAVWSDQPLPAIDAEGKLWELAEEELSKPSKSSQSTRNIIAFQEQLQDNPDARYLVTCVAFEHH